MWFLKSRKVQIAIGSLIAAVVAELGFNLDPMIIGSIIATGLSLILGIAHEDSGAKSATIVVDPGILPKLDAPVMPGPVTDNKPKIL
jgi:hypothetical protein